VSGINLQSATWKTIRDWSKSELADAQDMLESFESDIDRTQFTRGYIKALRGLLDLPIEDSPIRKAESAHYE
jgi:hypothetical protein